VPFLEARRLLSADLRGRLIAENDAAGALMREYLYLGDTLVAVIVNP